MDREIKILHTADTHLGYKQYHSEVRRKDFFAAFEIVINDAIDMQVDAVVHAGDLFDSRNPTLEDLLETISLLSRLRAADIPFFGIVGNHESKQNTQWLDLIEEMGLAARLGKKPQSIGDVAIYGIDSVPKSKIPLFDYSEFEAPDTFLPEDCRKLLVMHQIVQPFPYAEWDCAEILEKLPFRIDAILLGDYHKYEKFKVGETWVTYPGSTERNSASEVEARSYNIITLSDKGLEISRRTIPTRKFPPLIRVELNGAEKPYEQIFSVINEHLEELPGSVVSLEITGDSGTILSFSEIEEYMLNKGVLVPRIDDRRKKDSLPEEVLKITFSDPDHAVANEIKRMILNDGGLIVDEVIRNPNVPRSRVDEETEGRLSKLIEALDFKDPEFRIEVPVNPARLMETQEARPDSDIRLSEDIRLAAKNEYLGKADIAGKNEFIGAVSGDSEMLRPSNRIESPEIKIPESSATGLNNSESSSEPSATGLNSSESSSEPSATGLNSSESSSEPASEPISQPAPEPMSEPAPETASVPTSKPVPETTSGPILESGSEYTSVPMPEPASETAPEPILESASESASKSELEAMTKSASKPASETASEPVSESVSETAFPEDTSRPLAESPEKKTRVRKSGGKKPEKEVVNLPETEANASPVNEEGGKIDELSEEKPGQSSSTTGKAVKKGQKKGKGKPAVPRQYNLGDYL